jgi:acetyl-CoA carboxylase biotin carboxyl carrier protein
MSETTASAQAKETDKSKKRGPRKDVSSDPSLNMDEVRELAELFNEQGFTEFEFENENIRVRFSKLTAAPASSRTASQPATMPAPDAAAETPAAIAATEDEGIFKITSPIVGTFYRSPGPDKEPYVKEGSTVSPETVVCIVEAMKLMNEIQAETSGKIVKVYVENGQPVEFGQPLFGITQ